MQNNYAEDYLMETDYISRNHCKCRLLQDNGVFGNIDILVSQSGNQLTPYKIYIVGYITRHKLTFEQLLKEADQQLFNKLCNNTDHCRHSLLPPPSTASQHHSLRQIAHNRDISERTGHVTDSNFLTHLIQHRHVLNSTTILLTFFQF